MAYKYRLSARAQLELWRFRQVGVTSKSIARQIGVPPSALVQWRTYLPYCALDPDDPRLTRLAAVLGLPRSALVESTDRRTRIRARIFAPLPGKWSRNRSEKIRA